VLVGYSKSLVLYSAPYGKVPDPGTKKPDPGGRPKHEKWESACEPACGAHSRLDFLCDSVAAPVIDMFEPSGMVRRGDEPPLVEMELR